MLNLNPSSVIHRESYVMLFNVRVVHGIAIARKSLSTRNLLRLFRLSSRPVNIGENAGVCMCKSSIKRETQRKKFGNFLTMGLLSSI